LDEKEIYTNKTSEILGNNKLSSISNAKIYNFLSLDKFSQNQLKEFTELYKDFAQRLSSKLSTYLKMPVNANIVSVTQMTFDDYIQALPQNIELYAFEFEPLKDKALIGMDKSFLGCIVDRMLGGDGYYEENQRVFTDIENSLIKNVLEKTIKELSTAFQIATKQSNSKIEIHNEFAINEITNKSEVVAIVTIETEINNEKFDLINLCFPYPALEMIIDKLDNKPIFNTKNNISTNQEQLKMVNRLNPSTVKVEVMLGNTNIKLEDLLKLKIGDVIKLENKTTDNMIMKINNNKKFFVQAGTIKNKVSVKITDRYDEAEEIMQECKEA